MSKFTDQTREAADSGLAFEKETVQALCKHLQAPWTILQDSASAMRLTTGLNLAYQPDVVLLNESTGKSVAVELKRSLALSMPNLLKFKQIQSAYAKSGTDFVLVVYRSDEEKSADRRILEYGINTINASSAEQAAARIAELFSRS